MTFKEKIKARRLELGLTLDEVAKIVGVSNATISRWESGAIENQRRDKLVLLAKALRLSPTELIDTPENSSFIPADNIIPMPKMRKVPLIGTIACGEPILADENLDGEVDIPDHVRADFALRCKGDSMITARIFDGDVVYVRQQEDVDNGQIAAVLIGDEATLKRVYKYPGRLELRPENPTFPVLQYEGEQLADVRILGLAVAFTSAVK